VKSSNERTVMQQQRFHGKTVLVTGSTGGIGQALAERFNAEGATLVLVDIDLGLLHQQAGALGPGVSVIAADVSDDEQTKVALEKALRCTGRIDIAVLNAGTEGRIGLLEEQGIDDFDRVMAVNVRGVFLWLSGLMRPMKAQRGGVITITSSTAGLRGAMKMGPYVASKHAVIGLAKTAALEGARHGIRVNTVNPGPIDTRMMVAIESGSGNQEERRAQGIAGIPLNRYGTPAEVAATIAFLSSDEAAYATGTSLILDGGALAGKF
jgi:NAD(P)-dependent dehydrogenase (short-subunit alcohol dehydrogenase family)